MKWGKLVRRAAALFLATVAVWWLGITSGAGLSLRKLLTHGAVQALAADSPAASSAPALDGWVGLLVGQSPYLSAGYVLLGDAAAEPEPSPVLPSDAPDEPAQDPAGDDDPTPAPVEAENIIAQTFQPTNSSVYSSAGGVFVYNRTQKAIDMEELANAPVTLTGTGKGPQILIIHTHATESYTQSGADVYTESDPYRTTDDTHNVVRVGDEMAAAFARAGLNVLHDRTLHDYPSYTGAYKRSAETVAEYLAAYPSISVVLDVHRDALEGAEGTIYKAVADRETMPDTAQVMLVVGTDQAGGEHPHWDRNLAFAMTLERELNAQAPTLARPITLRASHYNQQLSPGSLLVEVGTHGNTLQEAVNGARAFAEAAAPVILSLLPEA